MNLQPPQSQTFIPAHIHTEAIRQKKPDTLVPTESSRIGRFIGGVRRILGSTASAPDVGVVKEPARPKEGGSIVDLKNELLADDCANILAVGKGELDSRRGDQLEQAMLEACATAASRTEKFSLENCWKIWVAARELGKKQPGLANAVGHQLIIEMEDWLGMSPRPDEMKKYFAEMQELKDAIEKEHPRRSVKA